jgi:2-succinyl-6-hydroxy-2,4-cyclohexadiene-1-carboxylate synthase
MARDVVLLHGFTHTGASWDPVVAALGESYRALAPDIRGHGTVGGLQPVTLAAVLGDLDRLAPERFTLVGYSMGGRIALHAAVLFGTRIDRLVLIGASPGIAEAAERARRRADDDELAKEIEGLSIEAFARRWARTPVLAGQPAAVASAVHADRLRNDPAGLARALRGLGTGVLPSLWDRLGEIAIPVGLVVGERDAKFRAVARDMAAALPDADVIVVPAAGHAVHLEAPDAVAAVTRGTGYVARRPGG